ncbi:uracil-DNA glycosylase [Candidatus Pacearchaeota archaeon]|nr:MAG: uracil-DNA glycosylase [Candidatus Pacearchaeota archaeon]
MNTLKSLKKLNKDILKSCKKYPLCKQCKNIVVGEGNIKAKIMLIGQNPGKEEDKTGRPFVGKSGKYLNKVLSKNKIKREEIYITSVVKCKTPNNRKPTQKEIEFFMPFLIKQIKLIKPKIIVLMGRVTLKTPIYKDIKYIKTYHPAAAMRFPKIKKKFEGDFKVLGRLNRK